MRKVALAMMATAWCLATHDAAAQGTGGRDALVRDLRSEDPDRVARAVGLLPLVWPADGEGVVGYGIEFREGYEVTTELAEALVIALEREYLLGSPNGELNFALLKAVVATRHPLTADILMRTQWGSGAREGLLYFGPSVLPGVVELARSPEATPDEAWGALRVLEDAVERWDEALGPEIREALKEVAVLHLEGPPDSFVSARNASETLRDLMFDGAVALVKVLRDPELTAIARKARHPSSGRPGIPL